MVLNIMSKDKILMNGELLKSIFHLTSLYSPWLIIINSSTLHWSTLTTWWGSMFDWFTPSWFRLSVSESLEWVCTKTVFTNGTITRGCEKTYTGQMLYDFIQIDLIDKIGPKLHSIWFQSRKSWLMTMQVVRPSLSASGVTSTVRGKTVDSWIEICFRHSQEVSVLPPGV